MVLSSVPHGQIGRVEGPVSTVKTALQVGIVNIRLGNGFVLQS